jgi:hypothetical protein
VGWYNANWQYRVKITIDYTKVAADLSALDVLVTEANLPAAFFSHVKTDGSDIVVTTSDGTTKLKRDLIKIDTGSSLLQLRVRTDVDTDADTVLYLYYGYASASETNDTDTYDANHELFAPLEENPAGTAPQMQDRTANSNDGTSSGSMTSGDLVDAKTHKGLDLDGSDDRINFGNGASLQITDDLTVLAFVKGDDAVSQSVFNKYGSNTAIRAWLLMQGDVTAAKLRVLISDNGTSDTGHLKRYVSSVTAFADAAFHQIGITFDGGTLKLYIDGAEDTAVDKQLDPAITSIYNTSANVTLGGYSDTAANCWAGIADNLHIFSRVLTAEEIETRYNNENSPGTFYSCSGEIVPVDVTLGQSTSQGLAATLPQIILATLGQSTSEPLEVTISGVQVIDVTLGQSASQGLIAAVFQPLLVALGQSISEGLPADVANRHHVDVALGQAVSQGLPAAVVEPILVALGESVSQGLATGITQATLILAEIGQTLSEGIHADVTQVSALARGRVSLRVVGASREIRHVDLHFIRKGVAKTFTLEAVGEEAAYNPILYATDEWLTVSVDGGPPQDVGTTIATGVPLGGFEPGERKTLEFELTVPPAESLRTKRVELRVDLGY